MTSIILLAASAVLIVEAREQSVAIEGYLTCNGSPYNNAKIKLYDKDTFTLDDKLAEGRSDNRGYFNVEGTGNEITRLNTEFNVYHRCGMTVPVCYYKNAFKIPSSFVTVGSRANQVFNAQTIELSLLKKDRDCIN